MTLTEIMQKLAAHIENGTEHKGLGELYAEDAVSIEAVGMDGQSPVAEGLNAIRAKHDWYYDNFDVHDSSFEGPWPHGDNKFAFVFNVDSTHRESGQRDKMREIGVYTVADGKIVREEFFYPVG